MRSRAAAGGADEPSDHGTSGRRPLSPRGRTMWIGSALSVVLLVLATAIPIPYVGLGPGSTFNTLGAAQGHEVITFTGDDIPDSTRESSTGHLNMLTVRVVDSVPMFEAVAMWASGQYELAPRDEYYPPGKSKKEVTEKNIQMFQESQSAAVIAALRYLDYPEVVYVGNIEEGSPSWDILNPNDRIVAVDGAAVTDFPSLTEVMSATRPGQTVAVTVERDDETRTEKVELEGKPDLGPQGFLGVGVVQRPLAPFDVHIALEDIGGPSAGLMFTLGIIDRLTEGDMTGGRFIAGTGTIDPERGTVGPIGGVLFKERSARDAGAEFMLVPAANCVEAATDIPDGLTLLKVETLADAVSSVNAVAAGRDAPTC